MRYLEKKKRLRWMAAALVAVSALASGLAFWALPYSAGEPFYMLSLLFLFMASVCALAF